MPPDQNPAQSERRSDHFDRLTEACVEGGFRDAQETEVVSLWAHDEITTLRRVMRELIHDIETYGEPRRHRHALENARALVEGS